MFWVKARKMWILLDNVVSIQQVRQNHMVYHHFPIRMRTTWLCNSTMCGRRVGLSMCRRLDARQGSIITTKIKKCVECVTCWLIINYMGLTGCAIQHIDIYIILYNVYCEFSVFFYTFLNFKLFWKYATCAKCLQCPGLVFSSPGSLWAKHFHSFAGKTIWVQQSLKYFDMTSPKMNHGFLMIFNDFYPTRL